MKSGTSRLQRSKSSTCSILCFFRDRECSFSIASSPPNPTSKEYDCEPCPDLNLNPGSYDSFKIRREDAPVTKNDPVDLTKDEKDCRAPAMTAKQKKMLLQITDNLMKTKTSLHLQDPNTNRGRYFVADNDGYTVKKEPMDLKTLRRKLIDDGYASVQEYKRDFRLIIDVALQWFSPDSEIAKDAQALNTKFEENMMFSAEDLGDETPSRTRERRPRAA